MPGGRPSKFNLETSERIAKALCVGVPVELAARSAGVSYKTFRRWVRAGETQRKGPLRDFFLAVQDAQSKALNRWLAVIDRAALDGDWRAAAWKAEHAFPEFFGKTPGDATASKKGDPEEPDDRPLDLKLLSQEELDALERILQKQEEAARKRDDQPRPGGAGA